MRYTDVTACGIQNLAVTFVNKVYYNGPSPCSVSKLQVIFKMSLLSTMPPLNPHQWLYMAAFMGQVSIKRTDTNVSVTEFTIG
jgi:hypothetical protein